MDLRSCSKKVPSMALASQVLNISRDAGSTSSLENLLLELTTLLVRTFFLVCNLSWPSMWQPCPDEALSHCYQDLLLTPAHHTPVRSQYLLLPSCFPACTGAAWVILLQMKRPVFALVELHEVAVSLSFLTVLELDCNYSPFFYQPYHC